MWQDKKISVIFPTYNEKNSIRQAILGFLATSFVDEIVVVNNNAVPGTNGEVEGTGAILVHETRQGYGYAIQRGLGVVTGDGIIIAEPDGTFSGADVIKLLAYSGDCDVVYGTRTHPTFIWEGSNMGWFLKWGNFFVAKIVEVLFNSSTLSDVGCTLRYVSRPAMLEMQPYFTIGGSAFGVEMMLLSLILRQRLVQVPVNYLARVGQSSVTGSPVKAFFLGLRMISLVVHYWASNHLGRPVSRAHLASLTEARRR